MKSVHFLKIVFLLFISIFVILLSCELDEGPTSANVLEELISEEPSVLADGVSSIGIAAFVYDTTGAQVQGQKVDFSTDHGTITESAFSNQNGIAYAVLTSDTSKTDLQATVTAQLSDSTLGKKMGGQVFLSLQIREQDQIIELSHADAQKKELMITFVGVSRQVSIADQVLTADGGLSKTQLNIRIRQTATNQAVNAAEISISSQYSGIPTPVYTNEAGESVVTVSSAESAAVDTILVQYGRFKPDILVVEYVPPRIKLSPKRATISANGVSKLNMSALLVSEQNNPIPGAEIKFTTTDGLIGSPAVTDSSGIAKTQLTSSETANDNVMVIASFSSVADTAFVSFSNQTVSQSMTWDAPDNIIRNGVGDYEITVTLKDNYANPVVGTNVFAEAAYGVIDTVGITDENGQVTFVYTPDADTISVDEELVMTSAASTEFIPIRLSGVKMSVDAVPDSIIANGTSTSIIKVRLKTADGSPIPEAELYFSASLGSISVSGVTDQLGFVENSLRSTQQAAVSTVTVYYGNLTADVEVEFLTASAASVLLEADPNYIWVKETGNIEQTAITATVLSQTGEPVGDNTKVEFRIRNGTGGGERLSPSLPGNYLRSPAIQTLNGKATLVLRSGKRSGTVEIEANVVGVSDLRARTTKIVIRSGPPYTWIDPDNTHNVEPHLTLTFDVFNLAGWNKVVRFNPAVYIGDKYNNPVEVGTTVYLTTTGGIITTDVATDENGEGGVVLSTANPRPRVIPSDPEALAPHRIPNPNMEETDPNRFVPITVPSFAGNLERYDDYFGTNLLPNGRRITDENDGIAYVVASTHGRNQQGDDAMVWTTGPVVFSGPLYYFNAFIKYVYRRDGSIETVDRGHPTINLKKGETVLIQVEHCDINGNPVAAGSSLKAKTSGGSISSGDLMAPRDRYGYGSTVHQVTLTNTLDPLYDQEQSADVSVELDSPNGRANDQVSVMLLLE
ncbi:MAG: invasin domain 3-containing protein [candidate division KSB1 bacterium]|nr:invasin domain 3-containing protein [candidate division KSB1 bacterium]